MLLERRFACGSFGQALKQPLESELATGSFGCVWEYELLSFTSY